ncbi:DUF5908 family protein [Burkholderia ubonensis]|uniref:DUF5908 family protein n=1 Tax=Burkholderia ubonensis TaxID=101571 RepID=UPI000A6C4F42|nr:DUF5908 family protein [Burkholderia ubonensis]
MTIEIRELVIEARIGGAGVSSPSCLVHSVSQKREEEARWVALISQRVLEQLREERGRGV